MGGIVIVESTSGGSTTDGANKDLSNLTTTGENKFKSTALMSGDANNGLSSGSDSKLFINITGKANVSLDNINSAGNTVIQTQAKTVCCPIPVNTSGAVGQSVLISSSPNTALTLPAGGTWLIMSAYGRNDSSAELFLASWSLTGLVLAGGSTILPAQGSGIRCLAFVMKIA